MEKGRIKVSNNLTGHVKKGKSKYVIPSVFNLAPRDKYHGKDCEYELKDGQVVEILVDGHPIPRNEELVKQKEERNRKKEIQLKNEKTIEKLRAEIGDKFKNDSFEINECLIPGDTSKVLIENFEFDNFNLKFHQYARFSEYDKKFKFFQNDRKKGSFEIEFYSGKFPIKETAQRQKRNAELLLNQPFITNLKTSWRLAIGLGQQSVYDTSINLHHIYGIPFIPASSIKGVVRSWVISKYFNEKEEEALVHKGFCDLFGCPGTLLKDISVNEKKEKKIFQSFYKKAMKGTFVFCDAFPIGTLQLKTDIMNPHYPDYYGKEEPPTDFQNPVPIPFLTVEDTAFQFMVGLAKKKNNFEVVIEKENLRMDAQAFMKNSLLEAFDSNGIGAKTAVGYGAFSKV